MAKVKCNICSAKPGKRICIIKNNELICPVCCARSRNDECLECKYYQISASFENKKLDKVNTSPGSYFGSPAMQKSIMEASMDLMNAHARTGEMYDKDPDKFVQEGFELFNTEEFKDYSFTDDEINSIIKEYGEPADQEGWFHTAEGTEYYTNAVNLIMNDSRFREFSKSMLIIRLFR